MRKIAFITLLTIAYTFNLQAQNISQSKAKAIIEKSIVAMGGLDFLKNINTLYSDSKTVMEGHDVNWITKEMLPNKGSFDIIFQGRTVYKSWYDGKTGYELVNGEKKVADQDEYKDKQYKKSIFNEIDYLDSSLYQIDYIGEEEVEGKLCDKIKTVLVNGKIAFVYYEKSTSYLLKSETISNADKNSFSTTLYDDYKTFKGLTYFTKMTFVTEKGNQVATIVDLYYNKKISDKDFQ